MDEARNELKKNKNDSECDNYTLNYNDLNNCPECGEELLQISGCNQCNNCGWSKCQ